MAQNTTPPFRSFLRVNFVAGLFVVLPIGITLGTLVWMWIAINKPLSWLLEHANLNNAAWGNILVFKTVKVLDLVAPVLALLLLFVLVWVFGLLVRSFIGRPLLGFVEAILARVPLVGVLYTSIKQLASAFFSLDGTTKFKSAVLVQFPMKGCWVIGFITGDAGFSLASTMKTAWKREHVLSEEPPSEIVTVFVPTTPLPTQGFTLVLPRTDIQELPISVPDAIKLVVSGGIIAKPDSRLRQPVAAAEIAPEVFSKAPQPELKGEGGATVSATE